MMTATDGTHPAEPEALIRCTNLAKAFGGLRVLRDVSLELSAANLVGIIGPNGAGKTTLFNVISGFTRQDAGQCLVRGQDTTNLKPHQIAGLGVARTFQNLRIVSQMTVLDNVMLARPAQRGERLFEALVKFRTRSEENSNNARAHEVLGQMGLGDQAKQFAGRLSFGQQKLLTVACCLASEAPILLLDEPLAGVHPDKAEQILLILKDMSRAGKLVIFIEHDLAAVERSSDLAVLMDSGRIVAAGPPKSVIGRPEIAEAYFG